MQQRRGTASQWSGANPILNAGEIGWESDTNKFKIGDGTNHWADLTYFTDAESALAGINDLIDGAPGALNTLNELAAAINDDPAFFTTLSTSLDLKAPKANPTFTGTVSGVTKSHVGLGNVDNTSDANKPVSTATQTALDAKASNTALSNHEADTTNIHGIADTSALATKTYADGAVSTAVAALTKSSVGLGNVDNTSDANKPVSSAAQTALDLKAPKANPTFTGTVNAADLTLSGNLTVNGTTTTVNSTAINVNNQVIFEGATADGFETTLSVIDPTADRTVTLPDASGTLATQDYVSSAVSGVSNDYPGLVGTGLSWDADNDRFAIDSEYVGELAVDSIAGALNSGTGLQHNYDDASNTLTIDIDSTVATKTYADDAIGTHNSDTTAVHGISNTANLVATTDTGTVTSTMIANDTIVNADINASAAIDWTKLAVSSTVSATELGYVDGVTSSIQTQLNGKQAVVSGVSDTEIGYLDGVTSAIQTQLDAKSTATKTETLTNKTLTSPVINTPTGITKSDVGLGNADNTSDTNKPVSTATQTALDLKAPKADPTFTGTVVLPSTTSIGNVSATEIGYVDGVTSAIQTQLDAKLSKSGGTMTGDLTLAGAPSADLHAATKAYVDNVVSGINFHQPVRVATTANITLSGTQTIDGVSVIAGDRVLVKDQTDQKTNGIYVVNASTWSRAADADNTPSGELAGGDFCLVLEGTAGAGYGYVCSNTSAITIGSSNITYVAYNAAKAVTAGSGLTESTPGTLDIATGGVTSAMIADGAIVDADVNASAAIAQSKISGLTSDLAAKSPINAPTFTGLVTVAASGVAFTDGTQTKEGVPSRTPIVQKTASYTLSSLTERDSLVEVASSSGTTITIPTNSAVAYPVGTSIDILQTSTGQVTIAGDTGVTVNATPGLKLRTQWSSATLFKRATNTWVVYGDLTA